MPVEKSPEAFRTISEVADWLGVPAHVLRFWESRFSQVKPVKRAGGRRYYRRTDMELLDGIRKLLHDDGMTIRSVQSMLREKGVKAVAAMGRSMDGSAPEAPMAEDVPVEYEAPQILEFRRTPEPAASAAEAEDEPSLPFGVASDDTEAPEPEPAPQAADALEAEPEPQPEPLPAEAEPAPTFAPLPDLPGDPDDDDPAFARPPRVFSIPPSADRAALSALRDELAAIRRRLGDPPRRPPAG